MKVIRELYALFYLLTLFVVTELIIQYYLYLYTGIYICYIMIQFHINDQLEIYESLSSPEEADCVF